MTISRVCFYWIMGFNLSFALNFLAVGDWGGNSCFNFSFFRSNQWHEIGKETSPYYTDAQLHSVKGMDSVANQLQAEFVLALGDNFYHDGVIDENDSRFQTTYENVYTPLSLQKPWYAVAGNHDYHTNVSGEVAYTAHSSRWVFPSQYYSKSFTGADGATLDIIFIDTVELSSKTFKRRDEEGYFDPLPLFERSYASAQWDWIEQRMTESTADYLLVAGHYPVYSACSHGPTPTLIKHLLPLLEQHNAHYVNGHDHCMEHIKEENSKVNHFLSGMGMECCYRAIMKKLIPENSLQWYIADDNKGNIISGFSSFEVTKTGMIAKYYDQDGTLLYTAPAVPPRK